MASREDLLLARFSYALLLLLLGDSSARSSRAVATVGSWFFARECVCNLRRELVALRGTRGVPFVRDSSIHLSLRCAAIEMMRNYEDSAAPAALIEMLRTFSLWHLCQKFFKQTFLWRFPPH